MFADNLLQAKEAYPPATSVDSTAKDMFNHILNFSLVEQNEIITRIAEMIKKDRLDSLEKLKMKTEEINLSLNMFSKPI